MSRRDAGCSGKKIVMTEILAEERAELIVCTAIC